jgi:hypothetical protein
MHNHNENSRVEPQTREEQRGCQNQVEKHQGASTHLEKIKGNQARVKMDSMYSQIRRLRCVKSTAEALSAEKAQLTRLEK